MAVGRRNLITRLPDVLPPVLTVLTCRGNKLSVVEPWVSEDGLRFHRRLQAAKHAQCIAATRVYTEALMARTRHPRRCDAWRGVGFGADDG